MGRKLGQHFLKSKQAVRDIVTAADLSRKDTVLEIGPGKGALTEALLEKAGTVIAVEKDPALVEHLQETFAKEISGGTLIPIQDDIRNFKPTTYNRQLTTNNKQPTTYKLVANIPYYITGQLLRAFLTTEHKPETIVFLVQKEVARRIVAQDGKESILSVSVKAFGTPRYIKRVPARYFSPSPDVDSAILSIKDIRSPFSSQKEEEHFFDILHRGFSHKRKLLKNNLGVDEKALEACGIAPNARAENVILKGWVCLAEKLN